MMQTILASDPAAPGEHGFMAASKPLRSLHVLGRLDRGGAEALLMDIARTVDRGRLAIDVCAVGDGPGAYDQEFERLGGRVMRCPLRRNPTSFLRNFQQILRSGRYDIVHSHLYYFSGIVLAAAARARVPARLAHTHRSNDLGRSGLGRAIYRRAMRALITRYATHCLGPSESSMDAFWGPAWRGDSNKSVLYNGIRAKRFDRPGNTPAVKEALGIPLEARMSLTVGRFVWHKGQDFLVKVAAELPDSLSDLHFVLIGTGPTRQAVEDEVRNRGLSHRFRFLETPPNVDDYWLAADLFTFSSLSEGFPVVILEAAAAGLPVVAYDIAGLREAAAGCHSATLLPMDASASQWARAVAEAAGTRRLNAADRHDFLTRFPFLIERTVEELLRVYKA